MNTKFPQSSQNRRPNDKLNTQNTQAATASVEMNSGSLGMAYASMLFSIMNYGYSIGNRRPFPSDEWPDKDSARATEIMREESYLRNLKDHPSRTVLAKVLKHTREVNARYWHLKGKAWTAMADLKKIKIDETGLQAILAAIKDSSLNNCLVERARTSKIFETSPLLLANFPEVRKETCTKEELINYLQGIYDAEDISKNTKKAEAILKEGSVKPIPDKHATPENKEMIKNKVRLGQWITPEICIERAFSYLPIAHVIDICRLALKEEGKNLPHYSLSKEEQCDFSNIETDPLNHSTLIDRRLELIALTVKEAETQHVLPVQLLTPLTDYPCLVYDINPLAESLGLDPNDPADSLKTCLNNMLNTWYCALVNHYSLEQYGVKGVIWTETQASFGMIRPSLTDTGNSFRLSPGLVPDNFSQVLVRAYKALNDSISVELKSALQNWNNEHNLNHKKVVNQGNKNTIKNSLYVDNKMGMRGLTVMKALELIDEGKTTNENFSQILLSYFNYLKNHTTQDLTKSINRKEIFAKITRNLEAVPQAVSSKIAKQGQMLLIKLVLEAQSSCQQPIGQLAESVEKNVELLVNQQLEALSSQISAKTFTWDFSVCCTYIEHLMRLLKIKEDLQKIVKYSQKEMAELSEDSELSLDALPEKGGLAALTTIMTGISSELSSDYLKQDQNNPGKTLPGKDFRDEVYFEIGEELVTIISRFTAGNACQKNEEQGGLSFKVIDLAQFPNYGPKSQKSLWVTTEKWSSIDNKPDLLLVDITSATTHATADLLKKMQENTNEPPYCVITFNSDNKFSQVVDQVAMGEIRIHVNNEALKRIASSQKAINIVACINNIHEALKKDVSNSIAARSVRKVLGKVDIRRSLAAIESTQLIDKLIQLKEESIESAEHFLQDFAGSKLAHVNHKSKSVEKLGNDLKKAALNRENLHAIPEANGFNEDDSLLEIPAVDIDALATETHAFSQDPDPVNTLLSSLRHIGFFNKSQPGVRNPVQTSVIEDTKLASETNTLTRIVK